MAPNGVSATQRDAGTSIGTPGPSGGIVAGESPKSTFEDTCVKLATAKMSRSAKLAQGERAQLSALENELVLVGHSLQACGASKAGDEARAVLAEMWDDIDEALVLALASKKEVPDSRLPAPGEIPEWNGAEAEVRAALPGLIAEVGWSLPWPAETTQPVPTPCRAKQQPQPRVERPAHVDVAAKPSKQSNAPCPASSSTSPDGASSTKVAAGGNFRPASELLPKQPSPDIQQPIDIPEDAPDFDAVSRSILSKKSSGGSAASARNGKGSAGQDKDREWSEEWLRIADADQLEKIVPALEAAIHRSSESDTLTRNDIAGLEFVKTQIEEVLILPQIHPQLFASALTRPARGLLLFGPPGTGKTLLARWIAAECGATFFNINASSVLSKWIGEAEKTVKALFQLAADRQPSVIFIDEVDSLLSQRRDADNESSRRVKNEFLTSLEGADTDAQDKILLVGATNMPWELDHAALRRLPKRLYVPLPGLGARRSLLERQLAKHNEKSGIPGVLDSADISAVAARTAGFSGSDLQALLNEAAMGPVREASAAMGRSLRKRAAPGAAVPAVAPRNINMQDFECALRRVKPSFSDDQATKHRDFNEEHGTCRGLDMMQDVDDECDEGAGHAD